jgi:PAS domain S-box-containing protein
LVEDAADDAELILRELRRGGVPCACQRVQSRADLGHALRHFAPDIVLADHGLPQFNAFEALQLVRREQPRTPVIIVTGSLGEEMAVDFIKEGAADYVVKHRLYRLGPAIQRALALRRALEEAAAAETARTREEERFRKLVEYSGDVITLLDATGHVLFSTRALTPTLGYAAGEQVGRSVLDLVHPDDRRAAEQLLGEVLAQEDPHPVRADLRVRHKNGTWRHLDVTAVDHRRDPAVQAVVVTYHDVTERKHAEDELRRLTEFLTHAHAAAGIGSWEWDIAGDTIRWSDETYRIFGVAPAVGVIAYQRYLEFIHPDDRADVTAAISRSLETREPFALDHRIVRPDGSLHFLHGRGGVVCDVSGRPARMLGAVLDITARKQAEEALRRANDRLNAVIQSSPLAISSLDAAGIVRLWNPAAERLFGWTAAEVIGRPLPTVHGEEDEFRETRRRVMHGEPVTAVEVIRKKKDGTPVTVNLIAAPLHEADGRITGILGLIEDVTGIKRLEQQFSQAQKMEAVGRLAGGVAHDFNNLLTVITSYSELLLEDLGADDPRREDVVQIRKAAESATALTRQLLAFSRQQVLQPQVLDLNDIVAGTERLLRRLIGEDIQLATALAPDLGMVIVDSGQLEQVIMNLAVNARDAMPGGGRLTIETANVDIDETHVRGEATARPGRYVMLALSDTGIGMDGQTKSRIFEPFFTTKASGEGTGLGLSTVYGIVNQSGGFISVYSEPGQGTSFKVYFPWAGEPGEHAAPTARDSQPRGGTETVLVVEDAPAVRAVMRQVLERQGYAILEAPDGETALQVAAKHHGKIHLLLTDVVMPGVSGRELADQLVKLRPNIKVLYASGYTDDAIIHHGILEPGIAYLQKPFTRDALALKVREVLDGR